MATSILRSSTGVYHKGANNTSDCNGRSGRFYKVAVDQARQASHSSFCKKCFMGGVDFHLNQIEAERKNEAAA